MYGPTCSLTLPCPSAGGPEAADAPRTTGEWQDAAGQESGRTSQGTVHCDTDIRQNVFLRPCSCLVKEAA